MKGFRTAVIIGLMAVMMMGFGITANAATYQWNVDGVPEGLITTTGPFGAGQKITITWYNAGDYWGDLWFEKWDANFNHIDSSDLLSCGRWSNGGSGNAVELVVTDALASDWKGLSLTKQIASSPNASLDILMEDDCYCLRWFTDGVVDACWINEEFAEDGVKLEVVPVDAGNAAPAVTAPVTEATPAVAAPVAADVPVTDAPVVAVPVSNPGSTAVPTPGALYTITSGDSLSKIAQKAYGDKNQWKKIYEANKDKIKDPNKIWGSQVFYIP